MKFRIENFIPSEEDFLKNGFTIEQENGYMDFVTIPEGWDLSFAEDEDDCYNLLDKDGNLRGELKDLVVGEHEGFIGTICLLPKYDVRCRALEDYVNYEVYFGSRDNVICTFGTFNSMSSSGRNSDKDARYDLMSKATKYAEKNYPNYKDVNAYWNEPVKTKTKTSKFKLLQKILKG